MPKRTDIESIVIIGSGPIIIGQACEFDYSGTQALKALREEGYRTILVNSNPATIMTDPDLADRTYVEPLAPDYLEKIIARERPDAILPTLGGQTGLNLVMELARRGTLEEYGVKLIGADEVVIDRAENRQTFKKIMAEIGLDVPRSGLAHSIDEADAVREDVGMPCVIRPSFTLGGTGGGIAYNTEEFMDIARRGLDLSPNTEILIEESVIGWKEYELEVMRDIADNVVIVCSIENRRCHGCAHRRQRHRRARANFDGSRVSAIARCFAEDHPCQRCRNRRLEHSVRRRPGVRSLRRLRDEPAGVAIVGTGQQGDGVSHREDRGEACRRLHPRRNLERHHARDARLLRAEHRLLRGQAPEVALRQVSRRRPDPHDADEIRR